MAGGKVTAAVICTARSARVNQVRHAIKALANQVTLGPAEHILGAGDVEGLHINERF